MCKEDDITYKLIRIILNERCEIQYASIDHEEASVYLEKLYIFQKMTTSELPAEYDLQDYSVAIDKVDIYPQVHYMVTAVLKSECENCEKALLDLATGLYNRNYWEQIVNDSIFDPSIQKFSLILIDVDNLKEINDLYGHLAGDKVIEILGQAIKKSIRKEDIGLRYGGDEFIIILFNSDKSTAEKAVERIKRQIDILAAAQDMAFQISAGIASHDYQKNIKDMVEIADKGLYQEKELKKSIIWRK